MYGSILLRIYRRWKTRLILPAIFFMVIIVAYLDVIIPVIYTAPAEAAGLNYFPDGDDYLKRGFIINTTACRVVRMSAWDKSILPFLSNENPWPDCKKNWRWTYTENSVLIINTTAVHESGHSLDSVSCCYRTIKRVEQSPEHYDLKADSRITYSNECKPMNVTNPLLEDDFIGVQCTSKHWLSSKDVKYRVFHAVPLLTKTSKTIKKVLYWKNLLEHGDNYTGQGLINVSFVPSNSGHMNHNSSKLDPSSTRDIKATNHDQDQSNHDYRSLPPNVVILGLDATSRQNFNRNMKKTREYLQQIGAVEMLGYNKVGDGTYANTLAFLNGYVENDLKNICLFSDATKIDDCPFIWKKFDEANYLTLYMEDGRTYNSDARTAFVGQPTDFYFRPFILGLNDHHPGAKPVDLQALNCIGGQNLVEIILNYINDTLSFASRNNTPVFAYNWLTNVGHDDINAAQFADDYYIDFLEKLDLSNTILFVVGDHGYRYKRIRETFAGWLEDKLPAFWAYLPENIRRQFPTWLPSLQRNSERLTSPLDFYNTLAHILTTFAHVKFSYAKSKNGEIIPRKNGYTLFEDVPTVRKCREAGITENWCSCGYPRRLPTNDTHIIAAATKALSDLNHSIPKVCALLKLQKITAGGMIDDLLGGSKGNNVTFVVAFETTPGGFLFEATVVSDVKLRTYEVIEEIQRLNQVIKSHARCVGDPEQERLCYCSSGLWNV